MLLSLKMQIDIPLTKPQMEFALHSANYPALVGGLGCIRGTTRIHTENGLMRICDITSSTRVLSWNDRDQQFQLSLSGGAFPKGRANLYRIVTQQGEFVSSGHHLVFSSQGKYLPVQDLLVGHELRSALPFLSQTSSELDLKSLLSNAPHYSKTDEDYLRYYADGARQYGQQLLTEEEIDLFYPPSTCDAHKLSRKIGLFSSLHKDATEVLTPTHNHRGQSCGQIQKQGYTFRTSVTEVTWGDQTLTSCFGHTFRAHQPCSQSLWKSYCHRISERISTAFHSLFSCYKPLNNCSSLSETTTIISVEKLKSNEPYFDLQVLDTNNYICEDGFIHHNSGKTEAGIARMVLLMLENYSKTDKPCNTLMTQPTYDLLKLRSIPGTEDFLDRIGIGYKTNKSDYHIDIHPYGRILFRSYDRPERIVSFQAAHSLCDELDTLPLAKAEFVWRKISERTREKTYRKNSIACVTTPDQGITGFVYKKWVKKKQDGYILIKAPTASNPYLPDGYIEQIKNNYDPLLASMYLDGDFVSLNDKKVYHFFSREKHNTDRELQPNERCYIGVDFNVGGCCANVWIIDNNNVPMAVDEFVSHDTHDFVNNLSARYPNNKIIVYPDASGSKNTSNAVASDIDIINNAGFAVDAPDSNPYVRDRINCFNALLAHDKIKVNVSRCPELTNALEVQGYTDKNEPEKFNEHPAIDDWNDASGYFIHRRFQILKPVRAFG